MNNFLDFQHFQRWKILQQKKIKWSNYFHFDAFAKTFPIERGVISEAQKCMKRKIPITCFHLNREQLKSWWSFEENQLSCKRQQLLETFEAVELAVIVKHGIQHFDLKSEYFMRIHKANKEAFKFKALRASQWKSFGEIFWINMRITDAIDSKKNSREASEHIEKCK